MREIHPTHRFAANQAISADEPAFSGGNRRTVRFLLPRLFGVAIIVVALAIVPYRAIDSDSQSMLDRMTVDVEQANSRLAELAAENAALRKEIRALANDPRSIEKFARRDLGMIRPNEILVKVETSQ